MKIATLDQKAIGFKYTGQVLQRLYWSFLMAKKLIFVVKIVNGGNGETGKIIDARHVDANLMYYDVLI